MRLPDRRHIRVKVDLPVQVTLGRLFKKTFSGHLQDLSLLGASLTTPKAIPPKAQATLSFQTPKGSEVHLRAHARSSHIFHSGTCRTGWVFEEIPELSQRALRALIEQKLQEGHAIPDRRDQERRLRTLPPSVSFNQRLGPRRLGDARKLIDALHGAPEFGRKR